MGWGDRDRKDKRSASIFGTSHVVHHRCHMTHPIQCQWPLAAWIQPE